MKKLLLSLLAGLIASTSMAGSTSYTPSTLATINASQAGYTFASWKTGLECTIEDKGRIVNIQAAVGPTITKYDSVTTAVGNYRGTWTASSYTDGGVAYTRQNYNAPTVTYTAVPATLSSGAYVFSISTSTGIHNIALFPNGFYVSKTNNNLYIPGC